jgi:hypothetical protein
VGDVCFGSVWLQAWEWGPSPSLLLLKKKKKKKKESELAIPGFFAGRTVKPENKAQTTVRTKATFYSNKAEKSNHTAVDDMAGSNFEPTISNTILHSDTVTTT